MSQQPVVIRCLRGEAHLQGVPKPMLTGFCTADDLKRVAKAPYFGETETNLALAQMLQQLPADRWQRPPDANRIQGMAEFFSLQESIMPNPVLLAINPEYEGTTAVQVGREETDHGATEIYRVTIDTDEASRGDALWILDGQHRIYALELSTQSSNPVPLVILYNERNSYAPEDYAEIFAQVTTKATALQDPHRAWLEYAFELGEYEDQAPNRRKAFEAVIKLAAMPRASAGRPNPFQGKIRFNPKNPEKRRVLGVQAGIFSFDCDEYADLIYKAYYSRPPQAALSPTSIAEQLATAHSALTHVIPSPHQHVAFFEAGNAYIHEGFILGVLAYMRNLGVPNDWGDVFRRVKLDEGVWDFGALDLTTQGRAGTISKKIAHEVFMDILGKAQLPDSAPSFVSYLLGNTGANAELIVTDTATRGFVDQRTISSTDAEPVRRFLKAGHTWRISTSNNIGRLSLQPGNAISVREELTRAIQSRAGIQTDDLMQYVDPRHGLVMNFDFELYGGKRRHVEIRFIT